MPYWAYLWPGAYFFWSPIGGGPRAGPGGWLPALEIGCGLGLAGLRGTGAGGWQVTFTDYDEGALEFVSPELPRST